MPDGSDSGVWRFRRHAGSGQLSQRPGQGSEHATRPARVSLALIDPDNPYRHLQMQGAWLRSPRTAATRTSTRGRWNSPARISIRSASPAKSASCTKSSRNPPPEWA